MPCLSLEPDGDLLSRLGEIRGHRDPSLGGEGGAHGQQAGDHQGEAAEQGLALSLSGIVHNAGVRLFRGSADTEETGLLRNLLLAACLTLAADPAFAQSLTLKGPEGQAVILTAAEIAALPRINFAFDSHGKVQTYEGPLLIDVLARAGAPTGKALRGPALADVILVTSSDGYQVAYGLAEADPGTRPNRIILADKADGAPLGATDGPYKVVVEGDVRPARAARMVTAIVVIKLGSAVTAPASHAH